MSSDSADDAKGNTIYEAHERDLPDAVKRWIDDEERRLRRQIVGDPHWGVFLDQLANSGIEVNGHDCRYSLSHFLDLHLFAYPRDSIAHLRVEDTILMDLLWAGIYTITELKRRFQHRKSLSSIFPEREGRPSGEAVADVRQALKVWDNRPTARHLTLFHARRR